MMENNLHLRPDEKVETVLRSPERLKLKSRPDRGILRSHDHTAGAVLTLALRTRWKNQNPR